LNSPFLIKAANICEVKIPDLSSYHKAQPMGACKYTM